MTREQLVEAKVKVVKMSEVPREPPGEARSASLFTGPDVAVQRLAPDSRDYSVNVVSFGKGVRNKLHTHDCDQVLIVTSGKGIVATGSKEYPVVEGDVIFIPAGEKHWHGATSDSAFAHISLTRPGSKMAQLEK